MTTKTKTEGAAPWWERLVDTSEGAAGRLLRPIVAIAVVIVLGITAWNFFSKAEQGDRDRIAEVIYQGLAVLPDNPPQRFYGQLPHPQYELSLASYFYWTKTQEYQPFKFMYYGLVDPEKAEEFYDKLGGILLEFRDAESEVEGSKDAWLYWLTRAELHWYSALNAPDVPTRIEHFEKQVALLDRLDSDLAGHPILDLRPDPAQPERSLTDLWRDAATAEIEFLRDDVGSLPTTSPDEGLEAVITFADGNTVKIRFFSEIAPKSVKTFINNATRGFYDDTAVHAIDPTAGTVTFGDPLSKHEERPMIWHKGDAGFLIPPEVSAALPVERGAVSTESSGTGGHGFHVVVHTEDPEALDRSVTVFGTVVEGLEHFEALLEEEVFDEPGVENPDLPRRRIGIESVTVNGEIQHPGDDSWRPLPKTPQPPELTDDEKALNDKYFGREEEKPDEEPGEDVSEEPSSPADDEEQNPTPRAGGGEDG